MTDAHPARARLLVIDVAIATIQGRDVQGLVRPDVAERSLAILRYGARAYALGLLPSSDARMLCQSVTRLAEALPPNPDDRREVRA